MSHHDHVVPQPSKFRREIQDVVLDPTDRRQKGVGDDADAKTVRVNHRGHSARRTRKAKGKRQKPKVKVPRTTVIPSAARNLAPVVSLWQALLRRQTRFLVAHSSE